MEGSGSELEGNGMERNGTDWYDKKSSDYVGDYVFAACAASGFKVGDGRRWIYDRSYGIFADLLPAGTVMMIYSCVCTHSCIPQVTLKLC